ncbi:hypothetical protein [Leisingera thetidis]|uniref:hypothetical protein n=1 Tax=Leisingera thetidis TaxID=2930199 RepID=UPI0021F77D30|nr:hypothetical protein [Leisingera thetidis]
MRSLWVSLLTLVLSFSAAAAQASEIAEALTKLRTSFARTAFSHFKAMPLHLRYDVEVGEVIRIQDEQRLLKSSKCYPGLEIELDDRTESVAVSLSRKSAVALGLGGRASLYGIPASGEAEFNRSVRRSVQSILMRTSFAYPLGGASELMSPTGDSAECEALFPPASIPMGPGLLVSSVFTGKLITQQAIDSDLAAGIDASAKLTPRGLPVEVSGDAEASTSTRSVIAHLRPEGSFAVQSAFISRRALMDYYALAQNNLETWAELEALIESYVSGEEAGLLADIKSGIWSLWEKLDQPEETLTQYRERLFASEDADFVEDVGKLDVPEEAWDRIGVVAAAEVIVSTTIAE